MTFLVTVLIGSPADVPIFPICWLVRATIISSRGLGRVNPSGQGKALRLRAAGAAIAIILIAPTLLVVPARSLGLGGLVPLGGRIEGSLGPGCDPWWVLRQSSGLGSSKHPSHGLTKEGSGRAWPHP